MFLVLIQDLPLRGMVSIRKNPTMKTRIVVGQVESIYLPHCLNKIHWNAEGHIPIIPKTEGRRIMVSLFITREFGFTFNLTEENLKEVLVIVNQKKKGTHCLNRKAAIELYGTAEKTVRKKKH